jgi:LAS superfamily LD-carboxypeptidase LdcB
MIIEKLEVLKGIKDKIKITNEPGATIKQLVSLEKTAEKRQKNTQEKIINAINLLELLNKKITVASVSKETSMSFNTVKKYRKVIENREENRVRNQLVS